MHRILLTASLALLLSLASAPKAEAQDIGGGVGDAITAVAVGGALGLTSLGFAIADVVSFAGETPFDDGLVVADLLVGTLSVGAGIWLASYAPLHDDHSAALPSFGAAFIALGALEIVHGGWSLGARAKAPRLNHRSRIVAIREGRTYPSSLGRPSESVGLTLLSVATSVATLNLRRFVQSRIAIARLALSPTSEGAFASLSGTF